MKSRAALCLTAVLLGLIGCAPVKITGKVIPGQLSVITSVPQTDERLSGEGIADAVINANQEARQGTTLSTTADPNGMFSIPLKGDGALGQPITFKVSADGYLSAQVTMPTPTPNEKLLVVLKPMRDSSE